MLRPENPRTVTQTRYDDSDRPRTFAEHARSQGEAVDLATKTDSSPLRPDDHASVLPKDSRSALSPDETLDLFRRKTADTRKDTEQALESEGVTSAVSPKLTLDLGHSNISCLPDSVVDLIKDEVDRLSLSHNQISSIPLRFSDCIHLRYLNIRSNLFREMPKAVYKLPWLEILDISRNKVRTISPEISNLTSLRVFAIVSNRVEDLPTELSEMKNLQMLKLADNPLRLRLKKVIDAKEKDTALSGLTENERETIITAELKRFLARSQLAAAQIEGLAAGASSEESLVGTPKPAKRTVSSRFPVIPSNVSSGESTNEAKSSPIQATAPPVPARSHYRVGSGQGLTLKRPVPGQLMGSSERNRSNSESFLQATGGGMRSRRMGMLTKPKPDLDSIEETKANRNSHLRGFSHASVLKRGAVAASPAGNSSSSPNSPREPKQRRLGLVKKLSSLPEHKTSSQWNNAVVQGARGILYALYQIHPPLSGLIAAIKKDSKRTSLEITFYASSTHIDRLNDALEMADMVDPQDEEAVEKIEAIVQQDCETCVMAYTHVFAQLQDSVRKIVAGTDARYVRTLMLLLYGSILEIRNAINTFGFDVKVTPAGHKRQKSSGPKHPIQTIPEEYTTPLKPSRLAIPSQDGFNHYRPPGPRFRSDTAIQHPLPDISRHPHSTSTPVHFPGSTLTPDSFVNSSSTYASTSFSFRSRSHSRNTSQTSTALSSAGSTPRSVDAFHLPRISPNHAQINPLTGMTDAQEEMAFNPIYLALTRSFEAALQAIPPAEKHFKRCLQDARENHRPKAVQELWVDLVHRCKICFDASEALRLRLTNMNIKSPDGGRNDPSFWSLCKTFLQSFVDLVTEMREARNLRLLPQELILVLRPVQKTSREAGRLIDSSPWRGATDGATIMAAPTPYSSVNGGLPLARNEGYGFNSNNHMPTSNSTKDSFSSYSSTLTQHHMYQASSPFPPLSTMSPSVVTTAPAVQPVSGPGFSTSALSTSYTAAFPPPTYVSAPYTSPLPSTPLSAALGPAAQATVPTSAPVTSNNASSTMLSGLGTTAAAAPSTPATGTTTEFPSRPSTSMANSNDFFKGDVFQRADSLLNMPQAAMAGGVNFFSVRR
ncbi:hypothetical protein DV735_g1998, partial [Chaetothyriales sp. CBS 134920]